MTERLDRKKQQQQPNTGMTINHKDEEELYKY